MVTYKIVSDRDDLLKHGARTACNFWNRFIGPSESVVIRLDLFTQEGRTIARAYKPYRKDQTRYGSVEFNTKYLTSFTSEQIAGTIVHEIGHTLGIGFDEWNELYDQQTGRFTPSSVNRLAALADMEVELDGGPGTEAAHWDEERFGAELMTGYQDQGEYVLPVTIDILNLLGHTVIERLDSTTPLHKLLGDVAGLVFSRQDEIGALDLEHFEATEQFEEIPHNPTSK